MLIQLNPRAGFRELRWFAGVWFPAFCLLAGLAARRQGLETAASAIWIAAVVFGVAGLVKPPLIRPIYAALTYVTFPIGWVVSHVMLLTMYFVVMAPIGFLVRLFHDPMERAFDRETTTYWVPREPSEPTRYFRQF